MKKNFTRVVLVAENEKEFDEQVEHKRVPEVFSALIRLLAQVADEAATGENTWLTLGATKDRSALVVTIHSGEGTLSAYGGSLGELALKANDLL